MRERMKILCRLAVRRGTFPLFRCQPVAGGAFRISAAGEALDCRGCLMIREARLDRAAHRRLAVSAVGEMEEAT
jgi:hypothetical protein